ncbi:hypothetical protein P389DRAFT_192277 [Cystobasidium minutum MCA 4210]|uniref:uncharacterized protein n=1 Tax=Cystobasidium minutum MCA 4210 TaxID=1397322 RepID=UPI0034CE6896|eukprot:jgi/Rhomi1/192277/gm1.491_g
MDSPPSTAAGGLPRSELYEDEEDSSTLMLPRSQLESLSELEVTQVQTDLSTELYGFSPITFTSRVVDVANEVIYDVIDKIEIECMSRWVDGVSDADETRKQAVQKGVNRLETLLMAAVDLRFDQAEVWLLRNTFQVPRDLIPYILLPHHPQEGFSSYINKGEDEALMRELEGEITKVNSQREEIAMLDLVHERQIRRLKALKEVKSNLSQLLTAGGARDTLSSASKSLAVEVPSFITECKRLLSSTNATSPSASTATDVSAAANAQEQPWGQSREAYLAWRLNHSKHDNIIDSSSTSQDQSGNDEMLAVTRALAQQGKAQDAAALKQLLDG